MATTTGAIATVDPDRPPPLPLHSIPIIDLSLLSQSELFSLSMCSNSSFDLNRCDDVVIPKIDRSVFNESAGSRKQTYSRLRLAPAQSSTSTPTTIHRRTPRLRSSHTPTRNNINDAEQAENSQIIRMLKELFKSDHNFEDLVPIEVETDTNVVVPEFLNTETNVTNRKRGKPQKHENAIFVLPPDAKRMCKNTGKEVVVYDADRDLEIVNSRGVKVNLEDLGRLEDPYGFEIKRRTEGMSSKDELLGFLGGLNGEWGTSRKKRRVVDASDFGDALPKGWRLSLSIQTKASLVWLFCRRYISPSGRQFESCKEVSMYLLSLVGEENLDKPPTHTHSSVKVGVSVREDTRRNKPIVLGLPTSLPGDFRKQVKSNIVDPIDVQVEEVFKCLKCFMIFEGKVNLLNHQVLAHKTETSKLGSEISEWMVVKGGIFECQFCNKTFNERNEYNEHIGTHGTNETKTCEASEAPTTEKTVDPALETYDAPFGDKLISSSPQSDHKISSGTKSEISEHVHDLNILVHDNQGVCVNMNGDVLVSGGEIAKKCNVDDNELPEGDKVPEVSVSKSDFCLGHEASMSINESNVNFESSSGTMDCVDDKCSNGLGDSSAIVEREIVGMSNGQDAVSETGVAHADDKLECVLEQGRSSGNSPLLPSTNELLNPERNRKRGRPRRHVNADFIHPRAAKKMCNNKVKKVVACDADGDIEIVNSRGVKVNLENLGRLEDPYGLEIRRRTEGMSTKDELLGFLGGLNGHWGTSRKKRRVVDASEFGDAFPKGWMLSLSIKQKSGLVWLFCRRYISPSGRQFESCKEVSMYLLSLVGEENLDKSSHTQSNDCHDFASKGASVNADVFACEDITEKSPGVLTLSTSSPRDSKKQVNSDTVDPIDVQVEEAFKCLKCFMIFEGKVNILDHQVLAHKTETSKLGSEISEWMVVEGGIFECQFCNKTFNERNLYNEHIGTHGTNETKNCEASEAPTTENTVDPELFTGVPDNELAELNSAESNVLIETDDAPIGDKLISTSPQSDNKINSGKELKTDEPVHDLNNLAHDMEDVLVEKSGDEIERKCNNVDDIEFPEDKAPDVSASKSDFCLGHEASMSINISNGKFESSIVTVDCADEKCNQGLSDVSAIVEKDIVGMSHGQDAVSETGVTHVDDKLECALEQRKSSENSPLLPFTNESMGSVEKNVVGESASDEVLNFAVSETRVQSSNICEGKGFQENINSTHMCSSFDDLTSEKEKVINEDFGAEVNKLFDSENLFLDSHNASLLISSKKQDSPQNVGLNGVISVEKECVNEDVGSKVEEPRTQMNMEDFPINVNNASSDRSGEINLDDFQIFTNDESVNNEDTGVMGFNAGNNIEFCSLVPPVNEQEFSFQDDDVSGLYDSGHKSSQRGFLDHFSIPETYDDIFDEDRSIGIHELSLAFGNPHEQKKDGVNCSVVPSKIGNTFDVQTDLSMVNNSMIQDLKGGRESVGGSFSLSCNNETRAFSHNGNIVYPGRTWEDLTSSGSNQQQSGLANGHGFFRVDERYNDGFSLNGLRSGRSEPVEFRFLAGRSEHNPLDLQGGSSGGFPYNTGMEQGFGSAFWSGKNAMGGRNVITSVCAWCRNEFHLLPETQGGGGSLCPTCSAGMSGQVNML